MTFVLVYSKFMRNECLNSKYAYNTRLPISRLVSAVGDSILPMNVVRSEIICLDASASFT